MNGLAKPFALLLSLAGLLLGATNANAAVCTSVASAGWNAAGTWTSAGNCNRVPTVADDVIIALGNTVTMTAATANVLSVTVNGTLSQSQTLNNAGALSVAGTLTSTASMVITGTTTVTGNLIISAGAVARTFTGLVTLTGGTWNNSGNMAITLRGGLANNGGTFTAGTGVYTFNTNAQAIGGSSAISIPSVTVTAVTLTNNGTLTVSTTLAGTGTLTNTGTLNFGGASITPTLVATAAGNTVNYNRANTQTVKPTTYSNLTLSGTSAKTTTGVTVNGVLSMEGTATASAAPTYGASATLQYNTATASTAGVEWVNPFNATGGIIIANTGVITMNSAEVLGASVPLTINSGATLNTSAANNWSLALGGNFVNNGGTFTANASPILIANTMGGQSIAGFTTTGLVSMTKTAGTATFTGNVSGGGLTINGTGGTLNLGTALTHTFTGTWTTTAGTLNGGSSTLNIGGSCSAPPPVATFTAGTGTVNWNAAGAQTVCRYAYNNLVLSNSGAKTMTGVTTIGGNLSISGTATMTGNAAFTVAGALNYSSSGSTTLSAGNNISVGSFNQTAGTFVAGANTISDSGNWAETGTFTPGTGTVTLNGAAAQTISGTSPVGFNNLTVTNGASPNITLATNVTVAGTLAGTVTLTSTCPTDYTLTSTTPPLVLHSCPTAVSSINRANPDPTSAATVSWTVTFSKSVTGVDATAFTLAASGVSGAYITSVTGSGTTWTVTANTGIGSGTLGLNQTGPGSVVPTLTGTFTGQIYTISATPALAEYRMDEASWNGTVGEVVDSSGSGNNAQSFNSANTDATTPVIAGSPGTCRYGVFDNGTITQGYVQTPLPNLTTDFTVTAWIRTTNNTVGGQRILIDDQNNSGGYGLSLADGATGILRFYSRGITPIILDSTYTIANNTWYFVAAVADITNQTRTLYVFNAAGALLNSTTEAAWTSGTWGTDAGPVSIGAETNASGESPASFHFKGNLDEVRVYQKVLSQNALAAIAAQTHACPVYAPDHILILQDGSAIACNPESVTVRACANSDCSSLYTGGVSGNLTAGGNSVAFAIAGGYSDTTVSIHLPTNTSGADPQIVRLGTSSLSVTPADIASPYCTNTTTSTTNNTTACDVSVSKAGLLVTVPTLTAGFASGAVTLRAIRSSDSTTCVPLFASVTRTVAFWGSYLNPSTGTMNVQVNGSNVETTSSPAYTSTYSLSFDGTGTATTATLSSVRYDDAGLMQLGAHYAGSMINTPPDGGMIVTGTANFVVKPYGFKLTGLTCNSGDDPSSVSGHFCVAGGTFTGTVTPVKYDSSAANNLGAATPNFGQESTAQTVTFSPAALVNPTLAAGGTLSAFTSASVGSFSGGTSNQATATMVWPNVGTLTIQPTMNYLATGDLSSGGISDSTAFAGNVGRFYPHHFTLTSGGITAACTAASPFTYMDQPNLGVAFTVEARNKANTITSNYLYAATGGYANVGTVSAVAENANAGTDLGSRISGLGSPIWAGGAYAVSAATATFARLAAPDGTYDSLAVGVKVADVDAALANMNMRADTTGTCTTAAAPATDCTAAQVGSATKVRYGRLRLFNAYGSELLALNLLVRAEYWNSGGWLPNSADSCTTISNPRDDIALGNCTGSLNCAAGGNMDPATHLPTAPVTLSGGTNTITLTKPTCAVGPCPAGSLNLALNLGGLGSGGKDTSCICWAGTCPPQTPASQPTSSSAALPYLQFNWCSGTQDPTTGDPINDPNARATFGTAKNRFIYLRERY